MVQPSKGTFKQYVPDMEGWGVDQNPNKEVVHQTVPFLHFFRPSQVWSMLHYESMGASSQ